MDHSYNLLLMKILYIIIIIINIITHYNYFTIRYTIIMNRNSVHVCIIENNND